MADHKALHARFGLTPGKAALVGVLAVVLGGVLYMQFGLGGGTAGSIPAYKPPRLPIAAVASASPVAEAAADEQPAKASAAAESTSFDPARWKAPDLSVVVAYDPFALPAAFPRPTLATIGASGELQAAALAEARTRELALAIERLQKDLEELKRRGVHVIIGGEGGYVAVSGDRTLRVGDEINGFVVTAIEPDGVRVERTGLE